MLSGSSYGLKKEWQMRINLNCHYADKDIAKSLGARWDMARKVWYIVDVEDLTPFMRWIANKEPSRPHGKQPDNNSKPTVITKSRHFSHCECTHVLPWEDCEHTSAIA